MNSQSSHSRTSIAVIGAGISGLAAAHRLTERLPAARVQLFEASGRVGGILKTVRENDYLIEESADNFLTRLPWAADLCERLGLELLPTEPSLRRALVVRNGQVAPVPESFVLMSAGRLWPIVKSPILSVRGKLRLAMEPFIGRRSDATDESIASFARRRLGRETFERLAQPLVAGIYTADPEKLSIQATLPQFVEQEQQFGSLWRARNKVQPMSGDSGASYSVFVAPSGGIGQLVEMLANRLPTGAIRLNCPVRSISPSGSKWCVEFAEGERADFHAVLLALPAPKSADCVDSFDGQLSALLRQIEYAGVAIVAMGLRRDQIQRPINGFGFVVPQVENRQIIAASFASLKFPGRAADDRLLVRVFIGGALQPHLAELEDDRLTAIACDELCDLVGLQGEPEMTKVIRHPRSMPQYHIGHVERVTAIEQRVSAHAGLEIAGNAYHGVGIPQCIHSGEQAAERIAKGLGSRIEE